MKNRLKEYANVRFPENCKAILDVTKPPLCLDNSGKTDCSKKLCAWLDAMLQLQLDEIEKTKAKVMARPEDSVRIAVECRKENGVLTYVPFPEFEPVVPVLYFPNGVYLLDDTVSYTLENLQNYSPYQTLRGYELNRQIMFMGQSREGTILKLRDHAHGFEYGNRRNVISFMQGERSNVAWNNYLENLTIDVGVGNPGAVGVTFFGNNSGAVRNVTIRSSDPEGKGAVGLAVTHEIVSGCCVRNIEIEGFDIGILVTPTRNYAAMDNLILRGQRRYGIMVEQSIVSFHNVFYEGEMPALFVAGASAHVVLSDAVLHSPTPSIYPAIRHDLGCTYLRNIKTENFKESYNMYWGETSAPDGFIEEFSTDGTVCPFALNDKTTPSVPYRDFPDREGLWNIDEDWHSVNEFGAIGDMIHDDTDAIQRAMNAGGTVWFQPGRYLLTRTIEIPSTVKHVHFMNCDFAISDERRLSDTDAIFSVTGDKGDEPLLLEKLNGRHFMRGSLRFIRHDGTRTLHARDIHTQCTPFYFNTVPGAELYFEDAVCTSTSRHYCYQICFTLIGQHTYGHNMNPERSPKLMYVEGGSLWLLGFKAESAGTFLHLKDATCELLGGVSNVGCNDDSPILRIENSDVSASLCTNGYGQRQYSPIAVAESRPDGTRTTTHSELPRRFCHFYHLPHYVAKGKGITVPHWDIYKYD